MDSCARLYSTSFSLNELFGHQARGVISILRSSITQSQVRASTFPPSNTNLHLILHQYSNSEPSTLFVALRLGKFKSSRPYRPRQLRLVHSFVFNSQYRSCPSYHLQGSNSLKMPVNWKDPEAFTRLLASMVAAQDLKVYTHLCLMFCHARLSFLCSQRLCLLCG